MHFFKMPANTFARGPVEVGPEYEVDGHRILWPQHLLNGTNIFSPPDDLGDVDVSHSPAVAERRNAIMQHLACLRPKRP